MSNDTAAQSTILYRDLPIERLVARTENGFVHPCSGDMLVMQAANDANNQETFEEVVADHFEWCDDCDSSKDAYHHELAENAPSLWALVQA